MASARQDPFDPFTGSATMPPPGAPYDAPGAGEAGDRRSMFDDVEALIDDARTYVDAEISFQKTRVGFVFDRLKYAVVFGIAAAFIAIIAVIGLTVGLIIALTPLITAWGATAVVVLGLLAVAYVLVRKAGSAWQELTSAFAPDEEPLA
jgi:F0F1-type ATP synthase assembly protein I